MLTNIRMQEVASFRELESLDTDKKINLIYGLNGTGKSTFANFLYDPSAPEYSACEKIPAATEPIYVYSQKFIQDTFYEADSLKGIFSLSKENKAAEEKIAEATNKIMEFGASLSVKQEEKARLESELAVQRQSAIDEIWKIKTTYTGGDRVLEYCLDGLKGKKERLFNHLIEIKKPAQEPTRTVAQLRDEVSVLKNEEAGIKDKHPRFEFSAHAMESDPIFKKAIAGKGDSAVAPLIEQLANSDWVRQGLDFLPRQIGTTAEPCPFCQENTITPTLISNIQDYFDETFQKELDRIEDLKKEYQTARKALGNLKSFLDDPFYGAKRALIVQLFQNCKAVLAGNAKIIADKLANPYTVMELTDSRPSFDAVNTEIDSVNDLVKAHNEKLADSEKVLKELKDEFWEILRWQYEPTIARYVQDESKASTTVGALEEEISTFEAKIAKEKDVISTAQKETVNVDEAIDAINAGLVELGIDDIRIKPHADNLYRIVRVGESIDAFRTLSEGEKMIISFLYFCELCKGRLSADDTHTECIAVIDDPISSLSHVFVFNVGQLIRSIFFQSNRVKQVFVLTHSLYFFYELTDSNHERRRDQQKLFRMWKSSSRSRIRKMKYEEIQNDYQAYWSVVNDGDQPPALIANCMRNIVEYFFSFVRKKDLNNVFQMPELRSTKYQAFCRYLNRESHSLGQNVLDLNEFDYAVFREGLRLVFEKTGYLEHYEEMSKD